VDARIAAIFRSASSRDVPPGAPGAVEARGKNLAAPLSYSMT